MKNKTTRALAGFIILPTFLSSLLFAQNKQEDQEEEIFELSPFSVSSGSLGVTAGGAQDISFTREEIASGKIPLPSSFTAEGLLSEYDLPLKTPGDCGDLICVYGEATPVTLPELPEATHLAQIGFQSGIDPDTWQRAPINMIAVVDKSGSMNGRPLQLVRESLLELLDHLDERDQLSIVLYGDRSHVYLNPTKTSRKNRSSIQEYIHNIQSAGSTNMESGLRVGYELADTSSARFEGATRLMLFTDEQPNTGNTSESGFMGQMRSGSDKGYGLTTIGVGINFGAELANRISTVRGGNLFYFPDSRSMREKFSQEFETMVTELAYDMKLTLSPAAGYRIAGVYGIPGDMLQWTKDGRSLYMEVETLFLSLRKGAIYFALAAEHDVPVAHGTRVAEASLSYELTQQKFPVKQTVALNVKSPHSASLGLKRGTVLVDEYIALKKATALYHEEREADKAYEIVHQLANRMQQCEDTDIGPERELVEDIVNNLAIITGKNRPLFGHKRISPVEGAWFLNHHDHPSVDQSAVLRFHSNRILEIAMLTESGETDYTSFGLANKAFTSRRQGEITILNESQIYQHDELSEIYERLENDSYYLEDVSRLRFKRRGDKLELSIYDAFGILEHDLVLAKTTEIGCFTPPETPVEIEPITGLPKRG